MRVVSITPEIALDNFPVYAGGLGVLEADKFYAAARKGWSYTVLTFFYPKGYVDYDFSNDELIQKPQNITTESLAVETDIVFQSGYLGEEVVVRPYAKSVGRSKVVFFHVLSPERAAHATERLYVYEQQDARDLSAIILAKAAKAYITDRIGVENVDYIDLQESMGALITYLLPELKSKTRYVVHTIAPWTNFGVNAETVRKDIPEADVGEGGLSLYYVALRNTPRTFAVSAKHEQLVRQVAEPFSHKISHVTNGVDLERWTHPEIARIVAQKKSIEVDDFLRARRKMRHQLEELLRKYKDGLSFENMFVVAWPRRITRYKRPYFVEKLVIEIADRENIFFVLGGKAHPFDGDGHYFMKRFRELHTRFRNVVYLHDYDVEKAKIILSSVDLLLFTPFPGWEACGTSYMKAGINGVPSLSSRDGGILEVVRDGFNGWLFGRELDYLVNIYTDHEKAAEIEADYGDMIRKFREIHRLYVEKPEKYVDVQINALKSMRQYFDIEKTLAKYYESSG